MGLSNVDMYMLVLEWIKIIIKNWMVKKRFFYIFIVIFINDYFNFICVVCEVGFMEIIVKLSVYIYCMDRDVS